jgi:hypothetical protein
MAGTLEDIDKKQAELIRKVQAAAIFLAPPGTAVPASFTASASATLTALPVAWDPIGLVTKDDAYTWSRNVDMAETTSHGYVDPTRRDITSNVSSLAFTAQETKKATLQAYHNIDLTNVTADTTTGEFTFADPLQSQTRYPRLIGIGRDGIGANAIYIIRIMPRAILSEPGDQNWSDENELGYPMTFTATPDSTLGYSIRYVFGGPGWKALLSQMGITSAP